jgi:hypothetical protein
MHDQDFDKYIKGAADPTYLHLEDLNKNGFKKRYTQQEPWVMGVSYW